MGSILGGGGAASGGGAAAAGGGGGGGGGGLIGGAISAVADLLPAATYHPQGMPGQPSPPAPVPVPLSPVTPTPEGGGGLADPAMGGGSTSGVPQIGPGQSMAADLPEPDLAAMDAPAPNMSTNAGPVYAPPTVVPTARPEEGGFWNKLGSAVSGMGLDELKTMIGAAGKGFEAGGSGWQEGSAPPPAAPVGQPLNPVTQYGGGAIQSLSNPYGGGRGGLF